MTIKTLAILLILVALVLAGYTITRNSDDEPTERGIFVFAKEVYIV